MSNETELYQDAIDSLIDMARDTFPELRWDRDALDMKSAEETGAVEMTGQVAGEWADGNLIDAAWGIDIWLCVTDSGSDRIQTMQEMLMRFDDTVAMITWSQPERHYLYDVGKVVWRWRVNLWDVYLQPDPEPETETETETDQTGTETGTETGTDGTDTGTETVTDGTETAAADAGEDDANG